ncbi:MAG: Trimethylamine methyltransferase [Parcubacteria group bacterium GW2011_GWA2_45_30]|nr:MAG: Trimethylamine methyltransferase [Parcubacteria group bacterium GW2011_GWA2_45_30]
MNKNFRPGLRMIADETIKKIIEEALSILKKIGILVENQEALRLLKGAGMVLKENRVLITEDLVRTCLKSAPSTIKIYAI